MWKIDVHANLEPQGLRIYLLQPSNFTDDETKAQRMEWFVQDHTVH